jgi:hypothetical protein
MNRTRAFTRADYATLLRLPLWAALFLVPFCAFDRLLDGVPEEQDLKTVSVALAAPPELHEFLRGPSKLILRWSTDGHPSVGTVEQFSYLPDAACNTVSSLPAGSMVELLVQQTRFATFGQFRIWQVSTQQANLLSFDQTRALAADQQQFREYMALALFAFGIPTTALASRVQRSRDAA